MRDLPAKWEIAELVNLVPKDKPIVYGIVQAGPEFPGGVPYIKSSDVGGNIDPMSLSRTSPAIAAKYQRSVVCPGDIVFSLRGNIGELSIVPETLPEANLTQGTARISTNGRALNTFVAEALRSPALQRRIEIVSKGSTFREISLEELRRLEIPLPPLPEQHKIAEILRTWDTALEALTTLRKAKARRFEGLRDKLMAAASRIGRRALFGDFLTESREPGTDGATARKISVRLYGKGAVEKIDTRGGSSSTRYYRRKAGQLIWSKLDFLNGAFALLGPELDGYESTLDLPAFDLSDAVNPIWLIEYLTRPAYYTRQIHLARGQRKARRVSPEDWLASPVRLPDRRTQDRIAEILSTARHELTLIDSEIEALTRQKRGLMQKLLTGEWRVTPAASDDDHPEKEAHHAQ